MRLCLGLYNISHLPLQIFLSIERKRDLSSLVIIQFIKISFHRVDSIQAPKFSILNNISESAYSRIIFFIKKSSFPHRILHGLQKGIKFCKGKVSAIMALHRPCQLSVILQKCSNLPFCSSIVSGSHARSFDVRGLPIS